jgi:hypothetical protein
MTTIAKAFDQTGDRHETDQPRNRRIVPRAEYSFQLLDHRYRTQAIPYRGAKKFMLRCNINLDKWLLSAIYILYCVAA